MTPARDKAPRGGPSAENIGQDAPDPPYPTEVPVQTRCSSCGAGGRVTPTYWGGPLCQSCGEAAEAEFNATAWPRPWWEAPPAPHVAVLGPGRTLHGGEGSLCRVPLTVAGLGAYCERAGLTQVWVLEVAVPELRADAEGGAPAFLRDAGEFVTGAKDPQLSGYQKWWRPKGFGFSLHIPELEVSGSAFVGAESAFQLLCWVAWYEHATKERAPWLGGGSITSESFIRRTYSSRRRVDVVPSELPPVMGRGREARFHWCRPAQPTERSFRYCHALDLNLAYAAVASSLPLPVGECEHLEFPVTFDKKVPGLWLIEPWNYTGGPVGGGLLPRPWADDARRSSEGPHWVTTPTAERCAELGVEPIEAWVWPEHHAYLRPWYELIRNARTELLDVGGAPMEAVKQIARRGVGRLASPARSRDPGTDPLYQPYWAWAVIAECRARLHRRLGALEVAPVAIDTDAVYFLSSRASPAAFAAAVGLPLGDGLGQFKPAGTCAAAAAREVLEVGGARAVVALRELVKEAA